MATAKLIWRDPSRVQVKLKKGNEEVVLNETYNADLIPDSLFVFDDDGDPFSTNLFASIFPDFSIGYKGIIYSVDVVGKPPPSQTKVPSDGMEFLLPEFEKGLSLRATVSEESASPLPFVNRETECEQLAHILLSNHIKRKGRSRTAGVESQHRLTLATSAQMYGSGKSTFALNFLTRLRSLDQLREILERKYRVAPVQWLLGLERLFVDFRFDLNISFPLVESIRIALATKMSSLSRNSDSSQVKLPGNIHMLPSWKIVRHFENQTGKHFFIHLDEVSALGPFRSEGDRITLLYRMWTEISGIHNKTDSEVFCTGPSPTLFLLSKGCLSQHRDLLSPENAECILLDPLKKENVREIFEEFVDHVEDDFIDHFHAITSGVPRFVDHGVNFFTDRMSLDGVDFESRRATFLRDSAPFTQHLLQEAEHEMKPHLRVQHSMRKFFLELIRIAALRLPISLAQEIDGTFWGFEGSVMTLEICSTFPLYVQRCGADRYVLVVPPVVLGEIAKHVPEPRLPFWGSLQTACPVQAQAQNSGDVLEVMVQHILRLRVSEELHCGPPSLGERLPFLKGSTIEEENFVFKAFKSFPKITRSPTPGKSIDALGRFFDNPASAGFADVHPLDLPTVIKALETGVFYVPRSMSSSADLILKTDKQVVVEMQFKNGKQRVTSAMMAKALQKSCFSCCRDTRVVFVMIALTVSEEELPAGDQVFDDADKVIARRFGEGTNFADVSIPRNLEVIIVLAEGLKAFLTKENFQILHKSELDLTDMALATRSPSKRG